MQGLQSRLQSTFSRTTSTYYPLARSVQSMVFSTPMGAYRQSCQMLFHSQSYLFYVPGTHFNPWVERVHKQSKVTCPRLQCYRDSDRQDSNQGLPCPNQSTLSNALTPQQIIKQVLICLKVKRLVVITNQLIFHLRL